MAREWPRTRRKKAGSNVSLAISVQSKIMCNETSGLMQTDQYELYQTCPISDLPPLDASAVPLREAPFERGDRQPGSLLPVCRLP